MDLKLTEDGSQETFKYGLTIKFNPRTDHIVSTNPEIFDIKKAAALYFWLNSAKLLNQGAHIWPLTVAEERAFGIDAFYLSELHSGIKHCIDCLSEDKNSQSAIINFGRHISTIHFIIRNDELNMIVQIGSSDIMGTFPYEVFLLTLIYQLVYSALRFNTHFDLETGEVLMQTSSIKISCNKALRVESNIPEILIDDFLDHNWELKLETKLLKLIS